MTKSGLSATVERFVRAFVKARFESGFLMDRTDEYLISQLLNMRTYEERQRIEDYYVLAVLQITGEIL